MGRFILQTPASPSKILSAFEDMVHANPVQLCWAVAYSTLEGCKTLINQLERDFGSETWDNIQKEFITSIDYGITEPSALAYLDKQKNAEVRVANAYLVNKSGFRPAHAFHPKWYLFNYRDEQRYITGSANLTKSALCINTEAVRTTRILSGNGIKRNGNKWKMLWDSSDPLTSEFLTGYEAKRGKYVRKPALKKFLTIDPPAIPASTSRTLWDELLANRLDPESFEHFWIEAGSMQSGGSQNQLEMPRGGNWFFGFKFSSFGGGSETIGAVTLHLNKHSFADRHISWHGSNKMERINLPTIYQGGINYSNTYVLFQRRYRKGVPYFAMNVHESGSPESLGWRYASQVLGYEFNLGVRGARTCGFF